MLQFRIFIAIALFAVTTPSKASSFRECCEKVFRFTKEKRLVLEQALSRSLLQERPPWQDEMTLRSLLGGSPEQTSLATLFVHFRTFACDKLESKLQNSKVYSFNLDDQPDLPEYLRKELKISSLSIFGSLDLSHVTGISMHDQRLNSLVGLKNLVNLKTANFSGNKLTSKSNLQALQNAESLDLEGNAIEDLSVFETFSRLKRLNLDYNCLHNLNPIKKLSSKLRWISLNHNIFTKVDLIRAGDGFAKSNPFAKTKPHPRFKYGLKEVYLFSPFNDFEYCPFKKPTRCFFEKPKAHWSYDEHHYDSKKTCKEQFLKRAEKTQNL